MPTYAYACTECDHHFEVRQSFTEDALTECPKCEGRLRKLFNAVGVVFKGSGFYRTDSRNASSSTVRSDSGKGGDGSSSSGSSGTGSASSSGGASSSGSSSTSSSGTSTSTSSSSSATPAAS